jgi:hypothetical protein
VVTSEQLALPVDFGSVEPTVYDSLRERLGTGWSIRYFFEDNDCSQINLASNDGIDLRGLRVPVRRQESMASFAITLLEELDVLTDEAKEWLFADGFNLHSITFDTRHVDPSTCQRQPKPHFDIGRALFTGEHFGPTYILPGDTSSQIKVESEGGRLVGHDQTNFHHSRPSPLSKRVSRAVIKVSAAAS